MGKRRKWGKENVWAQDMHDPSKRARGDGDAGAASAPAASEGAAGAGDAEAAGGGGGCGDGPVRGPYVPPAIERSAVFDTYYRAQRIVPEEDYERFVTTLLAPLPVTFRINALSPVAARVRHRCGGAHGAARAVAAEAQQKCVGGRRRVDAALRRRGR